MTISILSCFLLVTQLAECYQFVFATCQAGMEKCIKTEVMAQEPNYRFAFSRPGLLTFKVNDVATEKCLTIKSKFIRNFGYSIGSYENIEEVIAQAQLLRNTKNVEKLRLHVYCRDEGGLKIDHPDYIIEKNKQVSEFYTKMLMHSPSLWWNQQVLDVEAKNDDEVILDVILGEKHEKVFVGYHIHRKESLKVLNWRHSNYPGNILPILVPAESPSRAYAKIEEILQIYDINISSDDVVVEIGSSPGGTSYSLLSRGVKALYGIDPCPQDRSHDPIVLKHKNFIPVKSKLEQLNYNNLPISSTWLLCDANIPPHEAVTHLLKIASRYSNTLKGMIFTCKINDEMFNERPERLLEYLNEIEMKIKKSNLFRESTFRQLVSNRQEVSLLAVTNRWTS